MREIVLDTETTGFEPDQGHRIVEIGCLEVIQNIPTGRSLQLYTNPEREMPEEAFKVHGIGDAFLADKPLFKDVADEFLEFIGDDPLVIHNAAFDIKFLNAELDRDGRPKLMNKTIDTVLIAREMFPGATASLDALCRRFGVDNSSRSYHGALLDCELLAEVYLELRGGRQRGLELAGRKTLQNNQNMPFMKNNTAFDAPTMKKAMPIRDFPEKKEEIEAHLKMLNEIKSPIWKS